MSAPANKYTVLGTFKTISEFRKAVVEIDEATYHKLEEKTNHIPGKSPLYSYETADGETHYTIALTLDAYEKLDFNLRKIARLMGHSVKAQIAVKTYSFTDNTGELRTGWTAAKLSLLKVKDQEQAPAAE